MLMECIDSFCLIEDSFFIDAVLKKLGYKKSLLGSDYKSNDKTWKSSESVRSFLMTNALKYFATCLDKKFSGLIEEIVTTTIGATRWYALKAIADRELDIKQSILEDVLNNDTKLNNKKQAALLLDMRFGVKDELNKLD